VKAGHERVGARLSRFSEREGGRMAEGEGTIWREEWNWGVWIQRIVKRLDDGRGVQRFQLLAWDLGKKVAHEKDVEQLKVKDEGYWESHSYLKAKARARDVFLDLGHSLEAVEKAMESI